MRRYLILAVALALLTAQAMIVGIGLFAPNVSQEYRAFFIDHTQTEWHGGP